MATQPGLGLLPERRTGLARRCSRCPAFAGQNLKQDGLCPIGGKDWRLSGWTAGLVAFPDGGPRNLYERQKLCYKALSECTETNSGRRMAKLAM